MPFVRSTFWTYFLGCPADASYRGGGQAHLRVIGPQILVIADLDIHATKARLIKGAPEILSGHSGASGRAPPSTSSWTKIPETDWDLSAA